MATSDDQWLFLQDVAKLIQYAAAQGWKLTGGHLWRSPEEQARLVADGKSKTQDSMHLQRMAIDLNFLDGKTPVYRKEDLEPLGVYWESLSEKNRWGGFWKFVDTPHFERTV